MKKQAYTFVILMILMVSSTYALVGKVRSYNENNDLEIYVNVKNDQNAGLDDVRLRAYVLGDGGYVAYPRFDIGAYEVRSSHFLYNDFHYSYGDEVVVKVSVSNDDQRDSKYIFLDLY